MSAGDSDDEDDDGQDGGHALGNNKHAAFLFKAALINSFNNGSNDTAEDINNSRCPEL